MNLNKKIVEVLDSLYKDPKTMLVYKNSYELLIAVVLSAQAKDESVNKVTPNLFSKYPNFEFLKDAEFLDVSNIIKSVGLYKNKALNIIRLSSIICEKYNSEVPSNKKDLLSLPGVGNKTSNVILSVLFSQNVMPVDTHISRVSKRLNIADQKDSPDIVESKLYHFFKGEDFRKLHHQIIFFGREFCKSVKPDCTNCPLNSHCFYLKNNKKINNS